MFNSYIAEAVANQGLRQSELARSSTLIVARPCNDHTVQRRPFELLRINILGKDQSCSRPELQASTDGAVPAQGAGKNVNIGHTAVTRSRAHFSGVWGLSTSCIDCCRQVDGTIEL